MTKTLLILGENNPAWETHAATNAAIMHSGDSLAHTIKAEWCSTATITRRQMQAAGGFWMATGAPYSSMDAALEVIRYARQHHVPCLGTCQGFQHIMLEYAQSHLGIAHPGHAEYDRNHATPFITELACSLQGSESEIEIMADSVAFAAYGQRRTTERFYCRYGINDSFRTDIGGGGLRVSGIDPLGEIRIVEYPDHPFMVGTLFVPQARSHAENPHPLVTAFIRTLVGTS